jgi:hypothetical protein
LVNINKLKELTYLLLVSIFAIGCGGDNEKIKIDEYIVGTWKLDSVDTEPIQEKLPTEDFVTYFTADSAIRHSYSVNRNKFYRSQVGDFELTDTSLIYTDPAPQYFDLPENSGNYKLVIIDKDHYKVIAMYDVDKFNESTIYYYSRINNPHEYMDNMLLNENNETNNCTGVKSTTPTGYWKLNYENENNYVTKKKNSFIYIAKDGKGSFIWLDRRKLNAFQLNNQKVHFNNYILDVVCLTDSIMVFEAETYGSYMSLNFSRINPKSIIPDTLQFN